MNAKEILDEFPILDPLIPTVYKWAIRRALLLLDAAESNDGSTPESDAAVCRYTGGELVTFPRGVAAVVPYETSKRLEQERNGLARECEKLKKTSRDGIHHDDWYALSNECEEQARLLGMGSEREAALLARAEKAEAECYRLRSLIKSMGTGFDDATIE